MKWFRRWAVVGLAVASAAIAARGELAEWVQHVAAGTRLEPVFFKAVTVGASTVQARRPPAETRSALTALINAAPSDAELYSLRALDAEQQLDFKAAESDWVKTGRPMALADYYHRRLEPAKELAALHSAATPAAYDRAIILVDQQLLGFDTARDQFQSWIALEPKDAAVYTRYFEYAVSHRQFQAAADALRRYSAAFPNDVVFPVRAQAELEAEQGSTAAALALYDRSFQPLWPAELVKSYFELLAKSGALRRYLADARNAIASNPADINGPARVFYYWQQQGNLVNAQQALVEYEGRKKTWTADELWTLAQLYEAANNPDRAARCYYAMYSLQGAAPADAERALAGIAKTLFAYAGQGIRFGSGDLSYYRDIAQVDPYPGYLNGILSLVLNTTDPAYRYSEENEHARSYFHRARAAELVSLFDSRFPKSAERPQLHSLLLNAYTTHGDDAAVIRGGQQFRAEFTDSPYRIEVATLMANAYARTNQTQAEFALYDELLRELAAQSNGVPLGDAATGEQPKPRSPEYARILDRYLSRLVAMKRIPDAIALYRREIDRNPNDPGLYERLAAFLEQNKLGADVEATFRRAMAQFNDATWSHKLARWYLRQKQTAKLAQLTQQVTAIFSGTDLKKYFGAVIARPGVSAAMYRQLNLYAHQRFPHDLVFVRNLLSAYSQPSAANAANYEALLRSHWFHADDLRVRFFELLSRTNRLDAELSALGKIATPQQVNANPVAAKLLADGEAWRAHFESAGPVFRAITASYPVESPGAERASAIYRSLATVDPKLTPVAESIEQNLVAYAPSDSSRLTYAGEIEADHDRFDLARPLWNRIANIQPGNEAGYIESATVFWDYFLYDDALRVIGEGRQRLKRPALGAYEAGAIYENKRDYPRALNEYAVAALDGANDAAQRRLVRLARRPALRDDIERLTANLASRPEASMRALQLRAAVLENQGRRADLEQFFSSAVSRTTAFDTIDWIDTQARIDAFPKVQESAIERRIAITTDPIDRMRYQLALMRFYEEQGRSRDAQRVVAELLQAHPNTLGVVRAATDYYWRSNRQKRAVEVLTAAANRAEVPYRSAFRLEAARKATESGDIGTARQVLAELLKEDPYKPEYLTAMADTYAKTGDDRGLRAFYQTTITALAASNLDAGTKTERIAAMRRGLIPVLTRINDYTAAIDQYIEILNRYPEDEPLAKEAAAYAESHQLGDRLAGYHEKTAADSPRDYRWPMLLARIDVELERFPQAIDAYSKATAIRPDRVDLWAAQAALDERLLRFADAEKKYSRLFELTYHNPDWMVKVAEVRARQGQTDAAIAALRAGYIEGHPERADNYFAMASKLNDWGYVKQAVEYAQKGADVAGASLLDDYSMPILYARILGRARMHDAVYRRMTASGTEAPGLNAALTGMGEAVRTYYTPEEKVAFAAFLEQRRAGGPANLISAAESAGLEGVTASWLEAKLRENPTDFGVQNQLADLQAKRIRFQELGQQLERVWRATAAQVENRDSLLSRAAVAYQQAGDATGELRVLQLNRNLNQQTAARLCRLLTQQPKLLINMAASDPAGNYRDLAANCAIESGRSSEAMQAVAARGQGMPPVWNSAYTGLTGLYFTLAIPQVHDAFLQALGSPIIGDRLGKPVNRDQQIAGDLWFYYGSRFGEYLAAVKQGSATDYLPALLEASPGDADAYFQLASYYAESGDRERARVNFAHTLELDPRRGAAHDAMAELQWAAGHRDEAVAEWRLAFEAFQEQQDRGSVPPSFAAEVRDTLGHVGQHRLLPQLRTQADRLLKTWLRRNGTYQFEPLLEGILAATGDAASGVAWLVELSRSAGDPMNVLSWAAHNESLPAAQRDVLFEQLIDAAQAKVASSFGQERENAEQNLRSWQLEWLRSLVERKRTDRARALLNSIPEPSRRAQDEQFVPIEVEIAAQSKSLPALLARYAARPEGAPVEALRNGANELKRQGDAAAARTVLEYVYSRALEAHQFDAANFLGLAEIRLEQNNVASSVSLLRRMTMLSGAPFDALPDAAKLLRKFGKDAEAETFLDERVKAVPWDAEAREQLAALRKNTQELAAVASGQFTAYSTRAGAAVAMRGTGLKPGAPELDLLASSTPLTEAAVSKPYWYRARVEAAAAAANPVKLRLLQAAIAIRPEPFEPRLALFRTALEQKRYQLAISSIPVQTQEGQAAPELEHLSDWMTQQFLATEPIDRDTRAMIAMGLGDAYRQLNQPAEAAFFYLMAREMNGSAVPALDAVRNMVQLRAANDARRPVVTANLEQPHPVRPRLTQARGGAQ